MGVQKEEDIDKKISKHEFYFETPLYEVIKDDKLEEGIFEGDVDAYNSISGFDTTYKISSERIGQQGWSDYYDFFTITRTISISSRYSICRDREKI